MKKRDPIEKFIIENREQFDGLTASSKSWDKISARLDQGADQVRSPGLMWVFRRAAAAVIIVLAMYGAYGLVIKLAQTNQLSKGQGEQNPVMIEYQETEAFYASRIEHKVADLERIASENPQIIREIREEFELLDSDMKTLKNDLKEGVASEEILEAMVQNYRIKLQIVENMLEQISESNNQNNNDDENAVEI